MSYVSSAAILVGIYVSGERYLGSGNTDRHESLHDGRSVIWKELLPFGGDIFRGHQIDLPTLDLGILGLPPLPSPLLHSLPFLPSFSPPLPPSLSPGATPLNQLEGMGSAASSPTGVQTIFVNCRLKIAPIVAMVTKNTST